MFTALAVSVCEEKTVSAGNVLAADEGEEAGSHLFCILVACLSA